MRVAVVGLGIGQLHLHAWRRLPERAEVVAVCDVDEHKAQALAERHGVDAAAGLADVVGRDDVDVIDLCTPPSLHFDQMVEALAAGRHVICEKPLVGSLERLDQLTAQEGASDARRVMPIFQYRYGHGLQKLKLLVEEGVAGRAHTATVEVAWRRRSDYYAVPWRGSWKTELGGVLLSHALHAIDMLTYILGPARRVFARTATRVNPIEVEDCASAALEMADGSLASLSATLGSADELSRHRFCFANLSAESNPSPYTNSGEPWVLTGDSAEHTSRIEDALARFRPEPEGYIGQFTRFCDALADGAELPVTLADARASLELVTALYVSAREGRDIELPVAEDDPAYGGWMP